MQLTIETESENTTREHISFTLAPPVSPIRLSVSHVCAPGLNAGPSVDLSGALSRQSPPPPPPPAAPPPARAPDVDGGSTGVPDDAAVFSAFPAAADLAAARRRKASARFPPPPLAKAS